MIKVLVADDHEVVRTGIVRLLSETEGFQVIAAVASGEEAIQQAREKQPDILLMDVKMPGIGGIEATRKLARTLPECKVVGLSASADETFLQRLLQAGARGYLTKDSGYDELVRAIRLVASGQTYIDPRIASRLLIRDPSAQPNPFEQLSEREMQVALMIVSCQKVQEIADSLFVSPRTINTYRYRIFEKLKVRNDVELTHLALRHHLIDVTD